MKWYDDLGPESSWGSLWSSYTVCGNCHAIWKCDDCPGCGAESHSTSPIKLQLADGSVEEVYPAFNGAEGRFEDYVYLELMQREWKRPLVPASRLFSGSPMNSPSERAAIVLLFWAYFETRIDRLLVESLRAVSDRIAKYLLKRNSAISDRLDKLYRELFETSYYNDLLALGYPQVEQHIRDVQERRNRFVHGDPAAVDEALVIRVVDNLKIEHEAWIAVFNQRATHPDALLRHNR